MLAENAAVNLLEDDLAALADEDGPPGGRAEAALVELQSFTDLTHSKGRPVAALQWLPHRKVRLTPQSAGLLLCWGLFACMAASHNEGVSFAAPTCLTSGAAA